MSTYWQRVRGLQHNAQWYLACTAFHSMTMSLSSLLFNLYLLSLGFDTAFIGLKSALASGTMLVSALPAGMIADRLGRKRSMILGLAGMAVAQLGMALSNQSWLILAFNVLFGAFSPLFTASMAPFLTENSSVDQRSLLFTLNSSVMNLAMFVASTSGGYLPGLFGRLFRIDSESALAYRGGMLTSALTMALALVPMFMLQPDQTVVRQPRAAIQPWRFLPRFSDPRLLLKLVLPRSLMAFGAGLVFPFLNLFFKERFGVSDAALGWIFGITSVLTAGTLLWGGTVAERLGTVRTMFWARALSLPGLIVIGFVPSLPIVVFAHWARSALMRLGHPLYTAFVMERLKEDERATGSSLLSTAWSAGWAAGPYVSGLLQPHTGWGILFWGTILFYSLSLGLVYLFFVRKSAKSCISQRHSAH